MKHGSLSDFLEIDTLHSTLHAHTRETTVYTDRGPTRPRDGERPSAPRRKSPRATSHSQEQARSTTKERLCRPLGCTHTRGADSRPLSAQTHLAVTVTARQPGGGARQ